MDLFKVLNDPSLYDKVLKELEFDSDPAFKVESLWPGITKTRRDRNFFRRYLRQQELEELNRIVEPIDEPTTSENLATANGDGKKTTKANKKGKRKAKAKAKAKAQAQESATKPQFGYRPSLLLTEAQDDDNDQAKKLQPPEAKEIPKALLIKYNIKVRKSSKELQLENCSKELKMEDDGVANKEEFIMGGEVVTDEKKKKKKIDDPTDLFTILETTRPRHCELLKPLIFPIPKASLLPWAKHIQNLILSKIIATNQPMPFYAIGRHQDMHTTVTADREVLNILKEFLEQRNTGYFSYTPKEELRSLLVLRKPPSPKMVSNKRQQGQPPPNIIKALTNELENKLKITVARVQRFKSKLKPTKRLNLFLIEVSRDTDLQQLFKQTKLLGQDGWTWGKYKNKFSSQPQCRNCQRYGHVAINCHMPYRCVKCKDPHEPGECARSVVDDGNKADVYCHNCQQQGHAANYRGCVAYKERVEALKRHAQKSSGTTKIPKKVLNKAQRCLPKAPASYMNRNRRGAANRR